MQTAGPNFDDLYGVWQLPWWQRPELIGLCLIGLFALVALFYLVFRIVRARRSRSCPYKKLAMGLKKLGQSGRMGHDEAAELGTLFRAFAGAVVDVDAHAATDAEFSRSIELSVLDVEIKRHLIQLATWSIQPKFSPGEFGQSTDADPSVQPLIDRLLVVARESKRNRQSGAA
ncbi:MAG: hypothetical protein M1549_00615 [Candidatus Dependentiae bacterium]|nr:hypothetical protein [Candidatus Dependentiae bacterium]